MRTTFHIFANAALGKGLSGSDRIFIEVAKRLSKKNEVVIHVWEEGYQMCKREGLENVDFKVMDIKFWYKFGFSVCYFARIINSVWYALFTEKENSERIILYSASEFWMDSLPALILKLRFSKVRWVAAWFQTAPNPLTGFSQGDRKNVYRLSAIYYWLMQLPIKPLIKKWADYVLVNNELEKKQFSELDVQKKVFVMYGAVNVDEINKFRVKNKELGKIYDAVFQGRFHPQKGVVELVSIWKLVVEKFPDAKLVMIGDGPLMGEVKENIKKLDLGKNIYLPGYVFDGEEKYRIFSQSKIVVHPAFYDSGGMASAEAMAFGIPCVGFNLKSYMYYYPKGMIKVELGDLQAFSNVIVDLLRNKSKKEEIGREALKMIIENWNWDKRVNSLVDFLF